jgi:SAM-dependent methyltransferase
VACDNDLSLLRAASGLAPNVQRCLGDLERLCLAPASLDAIWLCRSMHAARDPLSLLNNLTPLLRPGGRLIVVENDTAHYPILPLAADFEHRLRDARLRYEHNRSDGDTAGERYKAARHLAEWLLKLGLVEVGVHTYVSEELAPFQPEVEAYWRLFLAWDAQQIEPYLSPADSATYHALIDPDSPQYLFARPGCYAVELTTVAWASRLA